MTSKQRARARDRLDAITAWRAGEIGLDEALVTSGLSRTRFYTVAAEFRTASTLASLGALAGTGASRERLDSEAINALQAVVSEVVSVNKGASVSQLVRLMVEAAGVESSRLPGSTRLRGIVEAEQRRREATGQAGFALKLDFTAINLPGADGRPYVLFTLIDEGTRLILGTFTSSSADMETGYWEATIDALARLHLELDLTWADRLQRIDITVDADRDRSAAFRARLIDAGVRAQVNLAPERYGRYFRKLVGERVGRVAITPLRTVTGLAVPDNGDMTPWSDEAATSAVNLAVDQHNMAILSAFDGGSGRPVKPDDLIRALEVLSREPVTRVR